MCDRAAECIRRLIDIIIDVAMPYVNCCHLLTDVPAVCMTINVGAVTLGGMVLASRTTTFLDGTAHNCPFTTCSRRHGDVYARQMPQMLEHF